MSNIKIFVLGLILLALLAGCSTEPQPDFSFVFMTDIHLTPERNAVAGFAQAIDSVNARQPDFVITGGDLVMDVLATDYDTADSLFTLYEQQRAAFTMPVYDIVGNHEYFGVYEKSGVDPSHPQYGGGLFAERLGDGSSYRSFDYKGWHFILLDAIGITGERRYIGRIDSVQLEWLKSDLAAVAPETPIVVATHIPFSSVYGQMKVGSNYATRPGETITNSKAVLDLFAGHTLKLVLQGHLHVVEEIVWRDTHFITAGAVSGAWWNGARDGFEEGYVRVDVFGDDFEWKYVDYGWTVE